MAGDRDTESDRSGIERILSDGYNREQPILVVGDGLVAGATAAFLEQAGLRPVVASTCYRPQTGIRMLWEPGLTLLERIGLRRPLERVGTSIERLHCTTADRSWTASDGTSASLVAVERDRLHTLLEKRVYDRLTESEQSVIAVEPTDSGVQVTFEGATTELFDTVVTTTNALLPTQTRPDGQSVHMWHFEWPPNTPQPGIPTEAWDAYTAAFSVPTSDGTWVRLVSMTETSPVSALSPDSLAAQFGQFFAADPLSELDRQQLQYCRRTRAMPRSLSSGGVVLAGSEARVAIPGDCVSTTLGIEDAWVLADAMAYGPNDIGSAIAEYERRRRRREQEMTVAIDDERPTTLESPLLSPAIDRLYTRRRLAFSHIIDRPQPDVARAVPHDI
jgi:2-polyprenyl-6-methoxyphenol hydroxylase-like FAD-dependent oxidoreductase